MLIFNVHSISIPAEDNLHASCVVSCADRVFSNAHYQMDSVTDGQFPLGTSCSLGLLHASNAYCINGKCVQFDKEDTPMDDSKSAKYHLSSAVAAFSHSTQM